jgi:hypothetical protein
VNQPAHRPASAGGSAGAKGAFLLVVAAILGIVLLQAFDTDFDGGSGVGIDVGGTTIPGGGSTGSSVPSGVTTPTTSGIARRAPADVSVLVANGAGIKGLGSQTADQLKTLGYNTLTAVDATQALEATTVQYAEGYQTDAAAIALTLGLPGTAAQPLNSPAVSDTQGANVIVLLGANIAGGVATTTSTTAA